MKRFVALILVLALLLSMSVGIAYGAPKGKAVGKDKEKPSKVERVEKATGKDKKEFKQELNEAKREVQSEIAELERLLEELLGEAVVEDEGEEADEAPEVDAETVDVEGTQADTEEETVMSVEDIESRLAELKLQKKSIINQRLMVVKSEYTPEELEEFESASAMLEEMNLTALQLGSLTIKGNTIKMDTPPYIMNGRTSLPVRAILTELGADVVWDGEARTVTVTMEGSDKEIVLEIDSTTVLVTGGADSEGAEVEGEVVELDTAPEIINGRTCMPIRFLAETFGFEVEWDPDTYTVDIVYLEESVEPVVEPGDGQSTTDEAITMEI